MRAGVHLARTAARRVESRRSRACPPPSAPQLCNRIGSASTEDALHINSMASHRRLPGRPNAQPMITSSACIRPPPSAHLDQDEGQRQRHRRCGARRAGGGQLPRGRAGVAHDEVAVRSLLLGQLLQQGVPQLMRRHTGHLRRMPPLRPFGALRLQGGQGLQVEAVAGMTPGGSGRAPAGTRVAASGARAAWRARRAAACRGPPAWTAGPASGSPSCPC